MKPSCSKSELKQKIITEIYWKKKSGFLIVSRSTGYSDQGWWKRACVTVYGSRRFSNNSATSKNYWGSNWLYFTARSGQLSCSSRRAVCNIRIGRWARGCHMCACHLWCPPVASRNCRRPFICLCWAKAQEQSPWWHYIGLIAVSIQKETENTLISAIISGRYFLVCYGFLSPSWSLKLILLRPR